MSASLLSDFRMAFTEAVEKHRFDFDNPPVCSCGLPLGVSKPKGNVTLTHARHVRDVLLPIAYRVASRETAAALLERGLK